MFEPRLHEITAAEPAWLALGNVGHEGRLLMLGGRPFALGRMIARGAEASAFELIDLRDGALDSVVKVCRFPPGSPEYDRWAIPVRFELNEMSGVPDVELYPAQLIEVPGGLVKRQPYVAEDPNTAWATTMPAAPIIRAASTDITAGVRVADELIARHGPKGILLEAKGAILLQIDDWRGAAEALELAYAAHTEEGNAGVYSTAVLLATAQRFIYAHDGPDESESATLQVDLGDGTVFSNTIFLDAASAGRDDSRQDRSMFLLLEVLAREPFFVGGLLELGYELLDLPGGTTFAADVAVSADRIDPTWDRLVGLHELIDRAQAASPPSTEFTPTPRGPPPDVLSDHYWEHRGHYRPEPDDSQAEARAAAARSNFAQGDVERALVEAERAVDADSSVAAYRALLAAILEEAGRLDESLAVLTEAVAELYDGDAYLALGEFLQRSSDHEAAIVELSKARLSEPSDPARVSLGLGWSAEALGDDDDAIAHYRRALRASPGHPWASVHLAQLLRRPAMEGDDSDSANEAAVEAHRVIDGASRRNPTSPEVLFCLAQSLWQLDRLEECLEVLRRAHAVDEHDETIEGFLDVMEQWHETSGAES